MKQGAAGSMHTGRASAACFHWGAFMKMEVSSIFSRFMSVKGKPDESQSEKMDRYARFKAV